MKSWPWLGRLLWLGCLGGLGLVETCWGAIYRCPDATGRQVFSNLPCPGGILVIPDRLPPQTPDARGARARPVRQKPVLRVPVERLPAPQAWPGVPPTSDTLATLPERGQLLCQRQPERCTRLYGGP